jgi:hypothetical protein
MKEDAITYRADVYTLETLWSANIYFLYTVGKLLDYRRLTAIKMFVCFDKEKSIIATKFIHTGKFS